MGMVFDSLICFGSNRIKDYEKLPKKIRERLDDGGDMDTFKAKDLGIIGSGFKEFYVEKYTDGDGEFVGFGVEISKHNFEDSSSSKKIEINDLVTTKECIAIFTLFLHFKIDAPFVFHFVNIW